MRVLPFLTLFALQGCLGSLDFNFPDVEVPEADEFPGASSQEILAPSGPCDNVDPAAMKAAVSLYETTEASVHELVTCGGAQLNLANKLILMMLASNEAFLEPDTRQALDSFSWLTGGDPEFTHHPDGRWEMFIPSGTDSWFSVFMYEPGDDKPLLLDPFKLDSWLVGAAVTSERTLGELMGDPNSPETFTWTYEELGPLGKLLDFGEAGEPDDHTFTVTLSVMDLLIMGTGGLSSLSASELDLGPFVGVMDLSLDSEVQFVDQRSGSEVQYQAAGLRDSLHGLSSGQRVDFGVTGLSATHGASGLKGTTESLAVVQRGGLSGKIRYDVEGVEGLQVISDFGDGRAYPTTSWVCPEE